MKKQLGIIFAVLILTSCGNKTSSTQVDTTVTVDESMTRQAEDEVETSTMGVESLETTIEEIETTTEEIETTTTESENEQEGVLLYNSLLFDNFGIGLSNDGIPMFMVAFTVENITDSSIMLSPEDYCIGRNGEKNFDIEWWTSASMVEIDENFNPIADATNSGTAEPHSKYLVTLSFTGTESNPYAGNSFDNYSGYELYYSGLLNGVGADKLFSLSYDYVVPEGSTYQEFVGLV